MTAPAHLISESEARENRAYELYQQGLGSEDIAVALFGSSDGILAAHVRDLIRLAASRRKRADGEG